MLDTLRDTRLASVPGARLVSSRRRASACENWMIVPDCFGTSMIGKIISAMRFSGRYPITTLVSGRSKYRSCPVAPNLTLLMSLLLLGSAADAGSGEVEQTLHRGA